MSLTEVRESEIAAVGPTTAPRQALRTGVARTALFSAATFTASALLFLVEPMVAKMLLPRLGGTPAVWNTAMVFFQMALLAGYWLAHLGLRRTKARLHVLIEIAAIAAAAVVLPISVPSGWSPPSQHAQAWWVLGVLTIAVGLPFTVIATSTPTLQGWFARERDGRTRDPYFLYAAGNAGSLVGLLAYPLVLEPRFELGDQARLWAIGYAAFAVLMAACGAVARREARGTVVERPAKVTGDRPGWRARLRWAGFASVPSVLLLGVTRHLTSDVASIPLLWIVPLGLYLLSFVVAFARPADRTAHWAGRALQATALPLAVTFCGVETSLAFVLAVHLVGFFVASVLAHARLSAERPNPLHLSEFYLWLSIGGAAGGVAATLAAPVLFSGYWEYPIALAAAVLLCPTGTPTFLRTAVGRPLRIAGPLAFGAVVVAAVVVRAPATRVAVTDAGVLLGIAGVGAYVLTRGRTSFALCVAAMLAVPLVAPSGTLTQRRSFFGVSRVEAHGQFHVLISGNTVHGIENMTDARRDEPLSYYSRSGPVGDVFAALASRGPIRVAVIGLGSGSIAGYGRPGDDFTFFEIDPVVRDLATTPSYFTFLADSRATTHVVLGDGRLSLARDRSGPYDLIVLDAFGSDSVPVHLLTREAFALYGDHLRPDGAIAVNVSNRYVDLSPVVGRVAAADHLVARERRSQPTNAEAEAGVAGADWIAIARQPADLAQLTADPRWSADAASSGTPLWTDTFSNVLSVLHLG